MKKLLLKIDDKAFKRIRQMLFFRCICQDTVGEDIELAHLIIKAIEDNVKTLTIHLKENSVEINKPSKLSTIGSNSC